MEVCSFQDRNVKKLFLMQLDISNIELFRIISENDPEKQFSDISLVDLSSFSSLTLP